MGLSHSADDKAAANGDRAEDGEEYHTPIANRRVQKLADPRSPTDDIQRTPMQRTTVDEGDSEFQDPRSPTSKIARTPVPDDSDPRSPTGGREPGPFVFPDPVDDPRSPSHIIARTPICKDAPKESSIEAVTVHAAAQKEPSEITGNNNRVSSDSEVTKDSSGESAESGAAQSEADQTSASDKCENGHEHEKTPAYEMKLSELMEKQTIDNGAADVADHTTTAVLSDRELVFLTELPPSPASLSSSSSAPSNTRKPSVRLALKEKFQPSSTTCQRSPLATRNLLEDSPDPTRRTAHQRGRPAQKGGVVFQKVGVRRRLVDGTGAAEEEEQKRPVRTVGRYVPVVDKENF